MGCMGRNAGVGAGQDSGQVRVLDSYGRLSRVPETGELEKIEDQLADNRKVIDRLGGVVGEELSDGLSAWKKNVRRPGWERLLERVASGASAGIVVWHTDRLFRQPRDLEKLIELADRGFIVAGAHGTRDLSDPDDRFILRIEVAHAARSSDDTQRRIKRRFQTLRANGKTTGGARRFGFPGRDRTWVPGEGQTEQDRPEVTADLVERERAAIRQAAERLLSGVSQAKVAREWNAAGLRTTRGTEWLSNTLRRVMAQPLNAGLIEYEGQLAGRLPGEPILDVETFERVRALIAGRRRGRVAGEVGNRYVATGTAKCGVCGQGLSARTHTDTYRDGERRRAYFCSKHRRGCGKIAADARAVDRELRDFVIERLSDSQHAAAIATARAQVADRLSQVTTEIAECEALQEALSDRLGRREITLDSFDKANTPLARDLTRLLAERDTLNGGSPAGPAQALSREVIAAQWDGADVAERRGMLTFALGRHRLVIDPVRQKGRRTFDPSRVRVDDSTAPPTRHLPRAS